MVPSRTRDAETTTRVKIVRLGSLLLQSDAAESFLWWGLGASPCVLHLLGKSTQPSIGTYLGSFLLAGRQCARTHCLVA